MSNNITFRNFGTFQVDDDEGERFNLVEWKS